MKEEAKRRVITTAMSSHVGVDWLMIIAAKEAGRQQWDSRGQVRETLIPGRLARQAAHVYEIQRPQQSEYVVKVS